jgi:hypothetical protein
MRPRFALMFGLMASATFAADFCPPFWAHAKAPSFDGIPVREGLIVELAGKRYRYTGRLSADRRLELRPLEGGDALYVRPGGELKRVHGVYGVQDYPIEVLHPAERVHPGRVNTESLAFRQWRYHTPESIPDEAFNAHYMTRAELEQSLAMRAGYAAVQAEDARLADIAEGALCVACRSRLEAAAAQEGFKGVAAERYLNMPGAGDMLAKAKAQAGSGQGFLDRIGVNAELSAAKVEEVARNMQGGLSHKYLLDSNGKAYLFTAADQRLIMEAAGIPLTDGLSHPQLASLVFGDAPAGRKLVGIGYFEARVEAGRTVIRTDVDLPMLNTQNLDFASYFRDYAGLAP